MKILYIHQYFNFPNQSGSTRSYDLAKKFLENGIYIEVIASTSNDDYRKKRGWFTVYRDGITVHYVFLPYSNELNVINRIIIFLKFTWLSTIKILRIKGDLVLATSTPLTVGIPALVKKLLHRTPYIFEVRDVWPEAAIAIGAIKGNLSKKVLYFLERIIYSKASAIVPLSSDMKESITRRFPKLKNKPIQVVEKISELSRFAAYESNQNILKHTIGYIPRFTVLYAGTFGRVNGLDYVVELAKKTIELDDQLIYVLIGNGAEKEFITSKSKQLGILNKNVFILDPIPKYLLPQWYYEINLGSSFVIPIKELWYNSANKFFDSFAAGRPIVINYEGWQKDVITRNNLGFVLPTSINSAAAMDFVNYTKNKELLNTQRINAKNYAKKYYSLENAIEKYISLINQSVKSSNNV